MAGQDVVQLTDANFHTEVIETSTPVLVDFWAPWCGPCRIVAPVVEELAREYAGRVKVGKLNVDENPRIAAAYQVRSIPALALFVGGRPVDGVLGAAPKARLVDLLERHVARTGSPS